MAVEPTLPDYAGPCVSNVLPELVKPRREVDWLPEITEGASAVVLLLLDGLGWRQLQERDALCPELTSMAGSAITTVAPSTTATALVSLTTGLPPTEHGLVGYRLHVDGEVLNVLRWRMGSTDVRQQVPPETLQPFECFLGTRPSVVTRAEFAATGFTRAHLRGSALHGWFMPSSLPVEVERLVSAGEKLVYAYYDGVDKVSHLHGLDDHFDAEIRWTDGLVGSLLDVLPPECVLVVTADHGQVDIGGNVIRLPEEILDLVALQSGEGRFRWLHARPGAQDRLLDVCRGKFSDQAWVLSIEQLMDERWLGPPPTAEVRGRLGDIALVPFAPVAFDDPDDTGPFPLVGRHGSLTEAEALVPLLAARGRRQART